MAMTLKQLLLDHPEWGDLEVVVYNDDGYDYVGDSGTAYVDDSVAPPVLVFAGN
jgi:hypothetical protein